MSICRSSAAATRRIKWCGRATCGPHLTTSERKSAKASNRVLEPLKCGRVRYSWCAPHLTAQERKSLQTCLVATEMWPCVWNVSTVSVTCSAGEGVSSRRASVTCRLCLCVTCSAEPVGFLGCNQSRQRPDGERCTSQKSARTRPARGALLASTQRTFTSPGPWPLSHWLLNGDS